MIIQQLARIAFADITQVVKWGGTVVRPHVDEVSGEVKVVIVPENWSRLIDSSEAGAAAAAIVNITRSAGGSIVGVRMRSPIPALVALGKHLGMFPSENGRRNSARGDANNAQLNKPLVYVDAPPPETAKEWEARQKRRIAESTAADEK